MVRTRLSEKELKRELQEYRENFPKLSNDELFVLWFLRAYVTDDEQQAVSSLTGGPGDKGVDAVLVDDGVKVVFVVQGKYRKKVGAKAEKRNDVISFADLAGVIANGDSKAFSSFKKGLDPIVSDRLSDARKRVLKRGYRLQLYYVTTGTCSRNLCEEAQRIVRSGSENAVLDVIAGRKVLLMLADYLDGVAPPIPSLELEMETGGDVQVKNIHSRYDTKTDIESWVFSMNVAAVSALYDRAGTRLFARNIRGFLGNTAINRGMESTLKQEPENFWLYNNGITIICDSAESSGKDGREVLRVTNPQIINGQQTTRTIHSQVRKGRRASVLVRVIKVSRESDGQRDDFETVVSKIVAGTNWQNAIRPSDLMSNDRRQIEIERQLRKLRYQYVRKRETKREARRRAAARFRYLVKKEELAQAVAACELDPLIVRQGKEGLFEEDYYHRVFPTSSPYYYLSRYWLMRRVAAAARGYPERAYAKWLVLHFVWAQLAPAVRSRAAAAQFSLECEMKSAVLDPLARAIDRAFKAALRFYRLNRGKGPTAIDVSTFFKRKERDTQFDKFWRGRSNPHRKHFKTQWSRFEKRFREAQQT